MRNRANNEQARVPMIKKPRSIFPINKSRKQTFKAGYLVPIFFEEVLPGDTWEINLSAFIRMLPQVAPPIDNLLVSTFFFFDPIRLEWENFAKQHGERKNPNDTIDYISPIIEPPEGGFKAKSLQDYLGKPINVEYESTPFGERMYNRIYNAYFRSEWLSESVYENDTDTDDIASNYKLLKITKPHDYFTDALPTLQAGPAVTMPLGTSAPIIAQGDMTFKVEGVDNFVRNLQVDPSITVSSQSTNRPTVFITNSGGQPTSQLPSGANKLKYNSGLSVDLSNAVAADIASLRLLIRTQEILEADMRNGVRLTEMLETRYGCINPDLRLTRPQYLGGTKTPLFTTPVVQTSGTGGSNTPQGNLAGYSVTTDGGNVIRASFGEFGHIMGIIAVSAIPQYQYGLHKKFTRMERFDYMYPEFQGISDQAILNKELFVQDDTITDTITGGKVNDEPWGYIGRYDEYRYFNNEICGELRSNYDNSLDVWTYAENMEELQNLNNDFIQDKSDEIVKRSMAVQYDGEDIEDQFLLDCAFNGIVSRVLVSKPIPTTGGRLI